VTAAHDAGFANSAALLVSILFTLNLVLFIFNLFPIPPLDGSAFLPYLVGRNNFQNIRAFMANPGFIIIGFLAASKLFGYVFNPVHLFVLNLLYPGANYA
jgi:Zn-dependent protease